MEIEIIGQVIGCIAAVFNILSYQFKQQKHVILMLCISSILFCGSYVLTGAITGGILNGIGVLRSIVYMNKQKFKAESIWWLVFFCSLYVTTYVLAFTVFGKPFNLGNALLELLPVIAMVATNIAFRMKDAKSIRLLGYVSSPTWLIYNIVTLSLGATITEIIALISITIGVLRLDVKKKNSDNLAALTVENEQNN